MLEESPEPNPTNTGLRNAWKIKENKNPYRKEMTFLKNNKGTNKNLDFVAKCTFCRAGSQTRTLTH